MKKIEFDKSFCHQLMIDSSLTGYIITDSFPHVKSPRQRKGKNPISSGTPSSGVHAFFPSFAESLSSSKRHSIVRLLYLARLYPSGT